MYLWREFFVVNETIILFLYGQVFFLLGLAITWQSRRYSRLDLARSLGWLGAFGLTHGLHEWGNIFIPIQAEYLGQTWIEMLRLVQILLLAFSFACLFQFGVETLRLLYPGLLWLQGLPAGVLLIWLTAFMWASQVPRWDADRLFVDANVWARYFLALPGALLAAAGLWQQTRHRIRLRDFSHIARMFQVASLALASYAIFAGLLGPPASFFPANMINEELVLQLLGMPAEVLRSLAGLVLVIAVVRGLEIFDMEVDRRFEEMEQTQILLTERERVSRELHDGAVQTVYTAGLMAESVRKKMDETNPLTVRMDRVISALQHAIRDLRQFITEMEPDEPGESLVDGLRKLAGDPHLQSVVKIELTLACADENNLFSPARVTHVLAIVNEALANVVRHAQARQVWLTAERQNGQLKVTVADDGVGLSNPYVAGFGLRNMRDRARLLNGSLQLEQKQPRGTQIVLLVPWEDAQ